ncbi:VOC family protein [uncultured Eudoraea sp.]|uniref:VOC family protein n=1 Tax=uncultured Eudoraea sp. TaxID=1035614 RepID=UPI0026257843|nr:VOC family protein [uncultured Eudoraea sp.]
MKQYISSISLLVRDYDEAIEFYTKKLHFLITEDTELKDNKRWVTIAPRGNNSCCLLLAKAIGEEQLTAVGNQSGGRVFLFLYTDDFWRDYREMSKQGVNFVRSPCKEVYGNVAVFEDLYGNLWDLIEPLKE